MFAALAEPHSRALYDESSRMWREHPERRPALLSLLVTLDVRRDGPYHLVRWAEFPRLFGTTITQSEYDAFLTQGDAAVDQAWKLFPALARGVSPTRPLLPRMARPVGDSQVSDATQDRARTALMRVVTALAERGDHNEVTAVRSYLDARMRQSSNDDRAALGTLVEMVRRGQP